MRRAFVRFSTAAAGVLVAVCMLGVGLSAAITAQVPEIDASAIPAGIGVLTAGILILRARRGAK